MHAVQAHKGFHHRTECRGVYLGEVE
jgi:hypothetical protein